MELEIGPQGFSIENLLRDYEHITKIRLSEEAEKRIQRNRHFLEGKIQDEDVAFYGINTGFGSLCNIVIDKDKIDDLQVNLIRSHAAGMGDTAPPELVRWMMLLKIQNMAYGYSGVRLELVNRLIDMFNKGMIPVVYQQGSLGASGDLAPLAHLSLPIMGEGEIWHEGKIQNTEDVLHHYFEEPMQLKAKEGLALLNGTQFSTAYGLWSLWEAKKMLKSANLIAACSIDAFNCQISPYHHLIHQIRPQKGQLMVAEEILSYLKGSSLPSRPHKNIQDPYAFRCIPQVHGASFQAITHVEEVLQQEILSVTDNPNVFDQEDEILSGGNFHAQPIALALDYMAIALAEIANISERRTYQLISGERGLPKYLSPSAGLHSGLMIAQYTAASIVSQNKQYCTPASVDSIVSSLGQEDHVSMAANAATKLKKVVENIWSVLGIEFLTACQALSLGGFETSEVIHNHLQGLRISVDVMVEDRFLHKDMVEAKKYIRNISWS